MKYEFEKTITCYAIEIDNLFDMIALMDSESYATDLAAFAPGNETLSAKLEKIEGVSEVDYDGHFGSYVYLYIEAESDRTSTKNKIRRIMDDHFKWCRSLELVDHVKESRNKPKK